MILVTGATGLLGNCIVRELLHRGEAVRVLCRQNTRRTAVEDLPVELHDGDLSSAAVIDRAVHGCSAVIHAAAMIHIGWQNLEPSRAVNVEGTRRIVQACNRNGAKLVHVSTVDTLFAATGLERPITEADPRPTDGPCKIGVSKLACSYVISKQEAEYLVREAAADGLHAVIVHPGFMLGPYDWKPSSGRMLLRVRQAPVLVAPCGGCSACDARGVAAAAINAIAQGKSGESYILAGENLTYQQLWQQMLAEFGIRRSVYVARRRFLQRVGRTIDLANRTLHLTERDVNGASIGMGNLYHYYDSSRAERELNYQRRPLATTIRDAWQWLKQYHAK